MPRWRLEHHTWFTRMLAIGKVTNRTWELSNAAIYAQRLLSIAVQMR
jgi:hypothetical protein